MKTKTIISNYKKEMLNIALSKKKLFCAIILAVSTLILISLDRQAKDSRGKEQKEDLELMQQLAPDPIKEAIKDRDERVKTIQKERDRLHREELARRKEKEKRLAKIKEEKRLAEVEEERLATEKTEKEKIDKVVEANQDRVSKEDDKVSIKKSKNKEVVSRGGRDLGTFQATSYCGCKVCCGKWCGSPTASGTTPTPNRTIAVDPKIIPIGSKVDIDGKIFFAEDTGSAIKGKIVDIFMQSHQDALKFGRREVTVKILN